MIALKYLVFDVESVGLYGQAFAVGSVIADLAEKTITRPVMITCPSALARGTVADRAWVDEHVSTSSAAWPKADRIEARDPVDLASTFWAVWSGVRDEGAWLAADVPFPVETHFLSFAIAIAPIREQDSPYPLVDVASVRLAAGFDPLKTEKRRAGELPPHNPLADAYQSARLLLEAFDRIATWRGAAVDR